jgi:hypothetical protein
MRGGNNCVSRKKAGLDRGPNAFSALRIRHSGRVTHKKDAIAGETPVSAAVDQVGMPAPFWRHAGRHSSLCPEELDKPPCLRRKIALVLPAEANVEVRSFPNAPAVPLEIVAEEELRDLSIHGARGFLRARHQKLDLLRHNGVFFSECWIQEAGDGTEVASGAYKEPGGERLIDNPTLVAPLDSLGRNAARQLGAGSGNEKCVELTPPDGVADGLGISSEHFPAAHAAGPKRGDRLQNSAWGIFRGVDRQGPEHSWSDPSSTNLLAGENRFVQQEDRKAGRAELPGATGSTWPSTNDDDVGACHLQEFRPATRIPPQGYCLITNTSREPRKAVTQAS